MTDVIKHSGIVDNIYKGGVKVRILQTSACMSCKVGKYCNAAESKEKLVDVYDVPNLKDIKIGDSVVVVASKKAVAYALFLAFGVPFMILFAVLFLVSWLTSDETLGAFVALASLVPYFVTLYFMRDKIRDRVSFSIE